jgi:hypothetical protein
MSEYKVKDFGCITNAKVYGLDESVIRAKYPMAVDVSALDCSITKGILALANCEKGTGHDNWLNGVIVQFDLTCTVKAWTEAERYHFLDFVSSQSTMHRIAWFDLDKQYDDHVDPRIIAIVTELRDRYRETGDPEDYLRLLMSNPCGFKLTAGMTTNYRQLKTIYAQRKNHRLPEWCEFCAWIERLPYAGHFITGKVVGENG